MNKFDEKSNSLLEHEQEKKNLEEFFGKLLEEQANRPSGIRKS